MSKPKYRYLLRFIDGLEKDILACDEEIEKGLIYFYDEDGSWFYACSVKNLVDMEVGGYQSTKEEPIHELGHGKPLETVLPKEHE